GEIREHLGMELVEVLRRHADVDLTPVDGAFGRGVADDELVVRGAAGVVTGEADERAVLGELAVAVLQRMFDEFGGAEVPEDVAAGLEPVLIEPNLAFRIA